MTEREEFEKTRRRLYALADRMGMKLTIIVRRKSPAEVAHLAANRRVEKPAVADSARRPIETQGKPFTKDAQGKREPGEE